jgi:hypothetical protein
MRADGKQFRMAAKRQSRTTTPHELRRRIDLKDEARTMIDPQRRARRLR